jgi:hypothetical protein
VPLCSRTHAHYATHARRLRQCILWPIASERDIAPMLAGLEGLGYRNSVDALVQTRPCLKTFLSARALRSQSNGTVTCDLIQVQTPLPRCLSGSTDAVAMPTESQLRDPALRALIAQRIDAGRLPLILTKTIAVGFGTGGQCDACGQVITTVQIEYDAFGPHYGAPLRLHWGCHVLWQLECIERARQQTN